MLKIVLFFCLFSVVFSAYSQNLNGTWKIIQTSSVHGGDDIDAIPYSVSIFHDSSVIIITSYFFDGKNDSVAIDRMFYDRLGQESLRPKEFAKLESKYVLGSFKNGWVQTTKRTKEILKGGSVVRKEKYSYFPDGDLLIIEIGEHRLSGSVMFDSISFSATFVRSDSMNAPGKGPRLLNNNNESWESVLIRARREKKEILVYCYSANSIWSKVFETFTLKSKIVQDYIRGKFIVLNLKLDTAKKVDSVGGSKSSLIRYVNGQFDIRKFPTFLFFSETGTPLHQISGSFDVDQFVNAIAKFSNPENQLYTLVRKARESNSYCDSLPDLSLRLRNEFDENDLANEFASRYYSECLTRLKNPLLISKEILDFMGQFTTLIKPSDTLFRLCWKKPEFIDSIGRYTGSTSFALFVFDKVIRNEVVSPFMDGIKAKDIDSPNWNLLQHQLEVKFDRLVADLYVLGEKVSWYWGKTDWENTLTYLPSYLEKLNWKKTSPSYLNACAWLVFKQSWNMSILGSAIRWSEEAISRASNDFLPMYLDTKACLLFKMGDHKAAISLVKMIQQKFPKRAKFYEGMVKGMEAGEPIWEKLK